MPIEIRGMNLSCILSIFIHQHGDQGHGCLDPILCFFCSQGWVPSFWFPQKFDVFCLWSCFNTKTCKPHVFFWSWEGVFTVILVNVAGIFVGNNEPPRKELEVMMVTTLNESVLILDHFEGDVFDTFNHSKSPIIYIMINHGWKQHHLVRRTCLKNLASKHLWQANLSGVFWAFVTKDASSKPRH